MPRRKGSYKAYVQADRGQGRNAIGHVDPEGSLRIRDDVILPDQSYGRCVKIKNNGETCSEIGYLATGLCVKCWDRTLDQSHEKLIAKNERARELREAKKRDKLNIGKEKVDA